MTTKSKPVNGEEIRSIRTDLSSPSPWTRPLPPVRDRHRQKLKAEAISIRVFAELLSLSHNTVRRWIKRGYIKAYKIGPLIRIPRTEVARMRSHRIPYIEKGACPVHTVVK